MSQETLIDLEPVGKMLDSLEDHSSGNLIPILQGIQEEYGYLPPDVLLETSRLTGIPASQMYGVATFYEQFHLEPRGKHLVRCCRGTACHVRGAHRVQETIEKTLGIGDGETTPDMLFTMETVACLGACALAPVMVIDKNYYGKMTPRSTELLLNEMMKEES
jgi:NADH-quinone oxidoreductase subunit E